MAELKLPTEVRIARMKGTLTSWEQLPKRRDTNDSRSKETSPILSSNSNSWYTLKVQVNCEPAVAVPAMFNVNPE